MQVMNYSAHRTPPSVKIQQCLPDAIGAEDKDDEMAVFVLPDLIFAASFILTTASFALAASTSLSHSKTRIFH